VRQRGRVCLLPLAAALVLASCGTPDDDAPAALPNLARGRPAFAVGASGDPAVVTDGDLAPEGTTDGHAAVRLTDPRSSVEVDLGARLKVGALLIQVSGADVYFVETSLDRVSWRTVWRVEALPGPPVARSRTTVLPRPVEARWLRIRPTTAGSPALFEIQAFEAEPRTWPPLDTSHPDAALPLWPSLTGDRLTTLYQALASLLMLVVGWGTLARARPGGPREERLRRRLLAGLALVALVAWPNLLNFHYHGFVHRWEFFHYYMGGKYLPELGYSRLYACTAVVDAEDGLDLRGKIMRDLRDNRLVPAVDLLDRSQECREAFSPERWDSFRADTRFFREAMGSGAWLGVRRDHGFNGTPAWAVLGGGLARLGPASRTQITLLALLDVGLILGALVVLGWAFGLEAACIGAGFWGVNALSAWGWTGGGFLRYDWVFWLVVGIAALRLGRSATAGFALGYAALLRVFPVLTLVGLGFKVLWDVVSERSLAPLRRQLRFASGLIVAGILFLAGSALMAGGPRIWGDFAQNSHKHLATESANLVGMQVFLAYDHDTRLEVMMDPLALDRHAAWKEQLAAATRQTRVSYWTVVVAFALLLALAVREIPDWAAAILGLGMMAVLLKLSGYYYCAFLVFAALWPLSAGVGLALVSLAWLTNVVAGLWPAADTEYAWLSLIVVAFVGGVYGALAWQNRRGPTGPAEGKTRTVDAAGDDSG
jgi:hypothetical protein